MVMTREEIMNWNLRMWFTQRRYLIFGIIPGNKEVWWLPKHIRKEAFIKRMEEGGKVWKSCKKIAKALKKNKSRKLKKLSDKDKSTSWYREYVLEVS